MRSGRRPRVRVPVINPNTKPMCSSTVLRPRNGNWRRRLSRAFKLGIAAYTSCRVNPSTACSRQGGLMGGIFKCRRRGQICVGASSRHTTSNFSKYTHPPLQNRTHAGGSSGVTPKKLAIKKYFLFVNQPLTFILN